MKIENIYNIFKECHFTVCTDTRKIVKESLFIALKGEQYNANLFVEEALKQGCKYAISDEYKGQNKNIILVDDTLSTLQQLAFHHRNQMKANVLGITGTNGKTTTKELIASVLKEKYNIIYTQGNFNNHIGVPLTLLTIKPETEIAIIEMGANHPGEIAQLCSIADPDSGIITNVGKAHLEGFGSFEGVINTKTELYRHLMHKNGTVFVNYDNPILRKHAEMLKTQTYGKSSNCNIIAIETEAKPTLKIKWRKNGENTTQEIDTHLIGEYNWENIMAAITIGDYFNLSPDQIKHGIENYYPNNHRSQWLNIGSNNILMDAYNANPTSMQLALNNFFNLPFQNKSIILGDMRELGEYAETEHQAILDILKDKPLNNVFLVGEVFCKLNNNQAFKTFLNVNQLIDYINLNPFTNTTLLIKGSHGIHLEKLMEIFNEPK
ncbi:MAG TPA: UDP-N-acetylmuramoyl-tripeptide--D-alanyl-D-alanine ligase [Bacteroidales bacterium]|nr:UDP-N-acetylmuramoyl-tripeptide--D-alanyl-D-alanine ligase [Bacteroidales bacterium]HNV96483.1 UDP-N-acetylmuramoyl-tripeptide--D-alanyl-D-alanine ligase [Bacteroidales bacterium]